MPRGGKRPGAGRPPTSATPRVPVSWRLPIHLVNAAYRRAQLEGITVTRWIELAIEERLKPK